MKFLMDLMACCGTNGSPVKEETRSLVGWEPAAGRSRNRRSRGMKRGRHGGNGGGPVDEWRPSLSSISEDNVLQEIRNEHNNGVAGVGSSSSSSYRNLKWKLMSKTRKTRSSSRCYRESAGRPALHTMVPTFSPTPFLF